MKGINELIRRIEEAKPTAPDDLLNGEHKPCECGSPSCGSPVGTPILEPGRRPGG